MKRKKIDPINICIGRQLYIIRVKRGLSQQALGKLVGISFQQIQKYERGTNRISVSRLIYLAKALEVQIDYFFQAVPVKFLYNILKRDPEQPST